MNTLQNMRFNSADDLCNWVNDYAAEISGFKIIAITYEKRELLSQYVLFYNENI